MNERLTVLCAAKLHHNQLERHLELLERLDVVRRVIVVRHQPLPKRLAKLENVNFSGGSLPRDMLQMFRSVADVLDREPVDWVIGFNPVPWGTLAHWAAHRRQVRSCLSLIGRDYQQIQTPLGLPFLRALRQATAVTITGAAMKEGLVPRGVGPEKLHILPHSVDLERFRPSGADQRYDIVSVGQLIERKRMHVLIDALGLLRDRGLSLTLGILGKGPEEAKLRAQVARLALTSQVEFLPYRDDVETVLQQGRIFALVSAWEGVPFALMEAMATGLVPVVTGVGTISDWVRDGHNGKIVPVDSAEGTARVIFELVGSSGELARLRERLLLERDKLGFEAGVAVWRKILTARPLLGSTRSLST